MSHHRCLCSSGAPTNKCRPIVPNLRLDHDSNTNEPYLEFYQHLMTLENEEVPQVISISYGEDEQVTEP